MAKTDTPDTPDAVMLPGEHNPFVNQQLHIAQALADEREALLRRVGANRDVLRNMVTMGFLSPEQAASIEEFYPTRERKPRKRDSDSGNDTFAAKEVAKNAA